MGLNLSQSLFTKLTQSERFGGMYQLTKWSPRCVAPLRTLYKRANCGSKHCMRMIKHITEYITNKLAY